jgi:spermidine synthase
MSSETTNSNDALFQGEWIHEKTNADYAMSFRVKSRLFSQQSHYQKVEVVDTFGYGRMLFNDGFVMVSERDEHIYHEMIAHVPLFLHPDPQSVLVIGGGDGGTVREVLKHPSVKKCTLCEIDAVVMDACKEHIPVTASCLLEGDPRLTVLCADGVTFLKESTELFDLIIIDSSDPIGPAAPLFGDDFYADVNRHLADSGIVVSQSESPFLHADIQRCLLGILKRQFAHVFIYNFTNMTYPGGLWSFSLAAKAPVCPISGVYEEKIGRLKLDLKYYTKDIHRAAFALPLFQKKNLAEFLSLPL